jgi:hypothetical protein
MMNDETRNPWLRFKSKGRKDLLNGSGDRLRKKRPLKIIPGRSIKIRPGNVLFGSLAILVVRL